MLWKSDKSGKEIGHQITVEIWKHDQDGRRCGGFLLGAEEVELLVGDVDHGDPVEGHATIEVDVGPNPNPPEQEMPPEFRDAVVFSLRAWPRVRIQWLSEGNTLFEIADARDNLAVHRFIDSLSF